MGQRGRLRQYQSPQAPLLHQRNDQCGQRCPCTRIISLQQRMGPAQQGRRMVISDGCIDPRSWRRHLVCGRHCGKDPVGHLLPGGTSHSRRRRSGHRRKTRPQQQSCGSQHLIAQRHHQRAVASGLHIRLVLHVQARTGTHHQHAPGRELAVAVGTVHRLAAFQHDAQRGLQHINGAHGVGHAGTGMHAAGGRLTVEQGLQLLLKRSIRQARLTHGLHARRRFGRGR